MFFCDKKYGIGCKQFQVIFSNNTLPSSKACNISIYPQSKQISNRKRTSRFVLKKKPAVITVEAALLFPLLIAGCMSLLFFIEVFRMESNVAVALTNTARTMGQYMSFDGDGGMLKDSALFTTGIRAVNVLAAEEMVRSEVGEELLEDSFVVDGKKGLSFLGSYIDGGTINLTVHYNIDFPVPFFELPPFPITQTCYLRGWSGAKNETQEDATDNRLVYITSYGSVYHLSRECSSLNVSVMKVSYEQVRLLRNSGGGKYYACEKCDNKGGYTNVWITPDGDCYHLQRCCSGLKRSVQVVSLEDVGARSCCLKCGNEREKE